MMIKTPRLELKPIQEDGLDALAGLFMDEQVKKTYMVPDFSTREDARKLASRIKGLSEAGDRFVAGIHLDGSLIGLMNETDVSGEQIELGYAVLPRYHNQGYCTEALCGAIGYLFDRGFREVIAGAFEENVPSIRVMEKSGMSRLDRQDEVEYRGKVHTCVYYSARKADRTAGCR